MEEMELQDLSDDDDYTASQQQGLASMMRSDSGKRSSSNEPKGEEIVYVKDNVAIHPTQFASERISGRLNLTLQDCSLLMTWIPYKGQSSNAKLSEKDMNLYAIKAIPFTEVRSIHRHSPALGWQYIIVVLSSGLAFPPLYFYNGGISEFLAAVKQHFSLARSAEDTNVFHVNDFPNPFQRTLSSLELPRTLPVANGPSVPLSVEPPNKNQGRTSAGISDENSSISNLSGRRQKSRDPARDLPIQLLEKFSLVTKFVRETTTKPFSEKNDFGGVDKRLNHHSSYNYLDNMSGDSKKSHHEKSHHKRAESNPEKVFSDAKNIPHEIDVPSDPLGFNKLSLVWGKPRKSPLGPKEWAAFLDSEGRVIDSKALRERVFYGGVELELRRQVWPFLLGYHAYDSTYAEREYLMSIKRMEYETIKRQWQSISPEQARRFTKYQERKSLIEKDVVRTDATLAFYEGDDNPNVNRLRNILLTYSFYNFDLGYCQGMSDYLSPLLFVMEDDSESFWCFVALMERLGPNFNRDQNGVHAQLFALSKLVELLDSPLHNYFKQNDCLNYFFCFRWILVQFKREFEYEKTMRLWEVLWTHYLSEHLHLYVCVSILKRYRRKIMGEQMDFDTLLKYINELSGHIDLDSTLRDAEALCICAGENGAACIPPGTPPSLPVDIGMSFFPLEDEVL